MYKSRWRWKWCRLFIVLVRCCVFKHNYICHLVQYQSSHIFLNHTMIVCSLFVVEWCQPKNSSHWLFSFIRFDLIWILLVFWLSLMTPRPGRDEIEITGVQLCWIKMSTMSIFLFTDKLDDLLFPLLLAYFPFCQQYRILEPFSEYGYQANLLPVCSSPVKPCSNANIVNITIHKLTLFAPRSLEQIIYCLN